MAQGLLIHEVSRSHSWVMGSSQIPQPDNIQHSQQKDIHAPGGIRTHNPSKRAALEGAATGAGSK